MENCTEQTVSDEDFNRLVDGFVDDGVDWGSEMKQKLLARRLRRLLDEMKQETSASAVEPFLKAMNPFAESAVPDGHESEQDGEKIDTAPCPFDPRSPMVNQLDGSMEERLLVSHKVLVNDVMQSLIKQGESHSRVLLLVAQGMSQTIEDAVAEMESVPKQTEEVLDICRAISTLLDVSTFDPDIEAGMSIQAAYKSSRNDLLADVSVYMHTNDYYKEMLVEFTKFSSGCKERLGGKTPAVIFSHRFLLFRQIAAIRMVANGREWSLIGGEWQLMVHTNGR